MACIVITPAWGQGAGLTVQQAFGPQADDTPLLHEAFESRVARDRQPLSRLRYWNEVAIDTSGLDHSGVAPGERRVFGEQLGPGRAARAMAIVHIAIFDALNAIVGGYRSYSGLAPAPRNTSANAAIAQAAHDTLVALYPSHKPRLDALLAEDLRLVPQGRNLDKRKGIRLGAEAAAAILAQTADDGAVHTEPLYNVDFIPSDQPGKWRQDPIAQQAVALGAHWGEVRPLVIRSGRQFRIPPPPALTSRAYADAYEEVKRLGGDGVNTPTQRTRDQTIAGIFWAYDGTPSLCAPPRLYNQVTMQIARQERTDLMETARLLALVNVAMSDAAIAAWESKWHYQVWRPVVGIREADRGTGPSGRGDGNPRTAGDVRFSPLGAPASNSGGVDFTPPFPAYPSGHAVLGSSLFQTLRNFFGTDHVPFVFVSDEWNGRTRDNDGRIRALRPRYFARLSEAEEENGQSRIYLGIHWPFDKTEGIRQGRRVADFVFDHAFQRIGPGHHAQDLELALDEEN